MSTFIKFGNHVIAPAGAKPTPVPTSPPPTTVSDAKEVLGLARLLQTKIKDLERAVAERKARRQEWRTAVDRLDKNLVALRAEDGKEDERLAKLVKRWNKTALPAHRHDVGPSFSTGEQLPRHAFELPRDFGHESRYVCPTTQAASAFNGNNERYRDTYTFTGSAWHVAPDARSPFSSPSQSDSPTAQHDYTDERSSFRFTMSPEALDVEEFSAADTPTKHGEHAGVRATLGDIQNTPQEIGESNNGRKRKTADFEMDFAYDGPHKRVRAGETTHYGSGRNKRNGTRWSLRRKNSDKYC
ncbi:hypothetical protein B0H19DRAFT_1267986 [Mycena capillaripes]|nr:hypothetical protein B0H19DRAFT_1267986 [Mycena capillaripes]